MLVAEALTGALDAGEIVEILLRQGLAGLEASGAVLILETRHALATVSAIGTAAAVVSRIGTLRHDDQLPITVALRDAIPVWVPNRETGHRLFPELAAIAPDSNAWAALPLRARGRVFGSFAISFAEPHAFIPAEQVFLRSLTDIAAPALHAAVLMADHLCDADLPVLQLGTVLASSPAEDFSAYQTALHIMIDQLADARVTTRDTASLSASEPPGSDPALQGLVQLCDVLLRRYERLSAINHYRQAPITPSEHLALLLQAVGQRPGS
jgi:GAF domain-containing protein